MIHNKDTKTLLYRTRLLLEEGRQADAMVGLEEITPENEEEQREVTYLRGWGYIQSKQWDAAFQTLLPLLDEKVREEIEENSADREKLAKCLLHLGVATTNLARYEDAALYFTLCLKVLHDRRVHLPSVRIKARYSLGTCCLVRGLLPAALQHYEEALRLSAYYNTDEHLADIKHNLCAYYQATGDLIQAKTACEEVLRLYEAKDDEGQQARVRNILGRIYHLLGYLDEANRHYTRSLTLASVNKKPIVVMMDCVGLAELRLAEGDVEEAKSFCDDALKAAKDIANSHMVGSVYHVVAKVKVKDALAKEGVERIHSLQNAVVWFEKAIKELNVTQAYADIAEVYGDWANALEEVGRSQEAIECWRSGYNALSRAKGKNAS